MSNNTIDQQLPASGNIDIKSNAIKFGIIGGLGGVIVSLILFFGNLQYESWSKWLQSVVMIVAIIAGIKAIADANKNKVTKLLFSLHGTDGKKIADATKSMPIPFGPLFKGGMLITLVIAIISILYFQLYCNIIEPDFVEHILEQSGKQMAEKGLSEEQIDKALEMSKTFMSPGIMSVISFFSSLLMGALISVIGAAIFKNEK